MTKKHVLGSNKKKILSGILQISLTLWACKRDKNPKQISSILQISDIMGSHKPAKANGETSRKAAQNDMTNFCAKKIQSA